MLRQKGDLRLAAHDVMLGSSPVELTHPEVAHYEMSRCIVPISHEPFPALERPYPHIAMPERFARCMHEITIADENKIVQESIKDEYSSMIPRK